MDDGRVLFQEFLRAPTRVATVTASSDALVAALLAPHRLESATGAGPGAAAGTTSAARPGAAGTTSTAAAGTGPGTAAGTTSAVPQDTAAGTASAAEPGTAPGATPASAVAQRSGGPPVVVELGAGTGRVTDAVQRRLRGRGRHLAIEINPVLAGRLAARHPGVTVVAADAARLPAVLAEHGVEHVDALVSLLPWAAYAAAPVPELAAGVLAPSGTFTQVTLRGLHLLPPARRQLRDLRAAFAEVTGSATVWRNLPPARILIARSPRRP